MENNEIIYKNESEVDEISIIYDFNSSKGI